MSPRTIKLSWSDPHVRRARYLIGPFFLAGAAMIWVVFRDWFSVLGGSIFALLGLGMLIECDTLIDADTGRLTQGYRLFGRYRLWLRYHHLSEFTAVVMERTYGDRYSDDPDDTLYMCLQRSNGSLMRIRCFSVVPRQRCVEAEQLARTLAGLTGLRLQW